MNTGPPEPTRDGAPTMGDGMAVPDAARALVPCGFGRAAGRGGPR